MQNDKYPDANIRSLKAILPDINDADPDVSVEMHMDDGGLFNAEEAPFITLPVVKMIPTTSPLGQPGMKAVPVVVALDAFEVRDVATLLLSEDEGKYHPRKCRVTCKSGEGFQVDAPAYHVMQAVLKARETLKRPRY